MGQTSNPTLRYPDGNQRPQTAVHLKQLAEDTKSAINNLESIRDAPSTAFVPVLRDQAGTALNLGTNGTIIGRQSTYGKQHVIDVDITRGAGAWVGTGVWQVDNLPIGPRAWWMVYGFGFMLLSDGSSLPLSVMRISTNNVGLLGPEGRLSNTYPSAKPERIGFRVFYERP